MLIKQFKQKKLYWVGLAALLVLILSVTAVPPLAAADSTWQAKYWNNKNLSGDPVLVRQEDNIDHDWGHGSPTGVNNNQFSARWKKTINFAEGAYKFDATMDDGMRVYLDGKRPLWRYWAGRWFYLLAHPRAFSRLRRLLGGLALASERASQVLIAMFRP